MEAQKTALPMFSRAPSSELQSRQEAGGIPEDRRGTEVLMFKLSVPLCWLPECLVCVLRGKALFTSVSHPRYASYSRFSIKVWRIA